MQNKQSVTGGDRTLQKTSKRCNTLDGTEVTENRSNRPNFQQVGKRSLLTQSCTKEAGKSRREQCLQWKARTSSKKRPAPWMSDPSLADRSREQKINKVKTFCLPIRTNFESHFFSFRNQNLSCNLENDMRYLVIEQWFYSYIHKREWNISWYMCLELKCFFFYYFIMECFN